MPSGEHEQTVTRAPIDVLNAVGVARGHGLPEGMVHLAGDLLRSPIAHARWPGVACVDELGCPVWWATACGEAVQQATPAQSGPQTCCRRPRGKAAHGHGR
ncbi:hypothetical protein [Streptomyces sp. NPDC052127]|uniref:hypothetical protein n=1 Tax=Streptomyces sp. NPDC052127 TaxID=3155679 RepID=UPI0034228000